MISIKGSSRIHKKQLQISFQSRQELIHLVTCEKLSVKSVHQRLGINYSTAKMIVRKYRYNGKITKFRRERQEKQQNSTPQQQILSQQFIKQNKNGQSVQKIPIQGQQLSSPQFPTIFVPNQLCYPQINFPNMAIQYFPVQQMIWWDPAQNYFSF